MMQEILKEEQFKYKKLSKTSLGKLGMTIELTPIQKVRK